MSWRDWNSEDLAGALRSDGEFLLAARHWTGTMKFSLGDEKHFTIGLDDGEPLAKAVDGDVLGLSGPMEIWESMLQSPPPRFMNDIAIHATLSLALEGEELFYTQYYPALTRAVELLRGPNPDQRELVSSDSAAGIIDAPMGRYVHLQLAGQDHRIYYEEAGKGIPLLLQHTAGSHGIQWRHLFEYSEITDHFRLIAYDLPFHGKSIPPTGRKWWDEQYKLTGEFLRSVPVALSNALELDQPVFMGCSVGGLLALDLAYHHPDLFRAVISLEGALKVEGDTTNFIHKGLYHPQVSNEFKGRLMHALTSPTAPEAYRRETIQSYMAGWPQAFLGDLNYYINDFDLRDRAGEIDTSKCAVHILNGEYDFSGTCEMGQQAHQAIDGSTWVQMEGMGHFPMCEDPERFVNYLKPVLGQIREQHPQDMESAA